MTDWSPTAKYQRLMDHVEDVLDDGETRTVRDIYYALESRGYDWEYDEIKYGVKKGRLAGIINPTQIVDTSRSAATTVTEGWDDPEEFVNRVVDGIWMNYDENFWKDQEKYVEVWLEKASLVSVFKPICEKHNVRLEATRGDWSHSKIYRMGKRITDKVQEGKDIRILYWGDFNPSGFHAPVAVMSTFQDYGFGDVRPEDESDASYFRVWPWTGPLDYDNGATIHIERVGMNLEHIERFDLPENPAPSGSDKDRELRNRFMTFVSEGRDINIELNALKEFQRDFLEERIEDSITQHVDGSKRGGAKRRVQNRRGQLRRAITVDRSEL